MACLSFNSFIEIKVVFDVLHMCQPLLCSVLFCFLLLFCVSRVTHAKRRILTSSLRGCPWRRPPRTPPPPTSSPTSRATSLQGSALPTQNSVLQSCCSFCQSQVGSKSASNYFLFFLVLISNLISMYTVENIA